MKPSEWPDLPALALLVEVEALGSLGAAADELGIAQPNASRSIAAMEKRLGMTLLHRSRRGSRLSAAGFAVLELARPVLHAVASYRTGLEALSGQAALTIAASQTIAESLTGAWLAELSAAHPGLVVNMSVCNSEEVARRAVSGRVQLGFTESDSLDERLSAETVASDRLVVVVAPNHPWAERRGSVTAQELATAPLVVRESGSGTREVLERELAHLQRNPPLLELSSNSAVLAAVAAGAGVAVLSELAVATAWVSGAVLVVPCELQLQRELRAVWAGSLGGLARELLAVARGEPG